MSKNLSPANAGGGMSASQIQVIAQAILTNEDRLHEGVDFCLQHLGGGRWSAWEEKVLQCLHRRHTLGDACVRYAREVIKGQWGGLEQQLVSNPYLLRNLVDYLKSGVVRAPCPDLEFEILHMPYASTLAYVYARWVMGRPWPKGEKVILAQLRDSTNALLCEDTSGAYKADKVVATEYTLNVLNGSWAALEQKISKGKCTPWVAVDFAEKVRQAPMPIVENNLLSSRLRDESDRIPLIGAIQHYVGVFPGQVQNLLNFILAGHCSPLLAIDLLPLLGQNARWKPFEAMMLGMPPSNEVNTAIVTYTTRFFPRRWKKAEGYFLAQRNGDRFRDAVILYAAKVIKGRWPRIETRLEKSPRHLLKYADEALKSRLPDPLENRMVMQSFAIPNDPHIRAYCDRYRA